jgi:hypothetical protein
MYLHREQDCVESTVNEIMLCSKVSESNGSVRLPQKTKKCCIKRVWTSCLLNFFWFYCVLGWYYLTRLIWRLHFKVHQRRTTIMFQFFCRQSARKIMPFMEEWLFIKAINAWRKGSLQMSERCKGRWTSAVHNTGSWLSSILTCVEFKDEIHQSIRDNRRSGISATALEMDHGNKRYKTGLNHAIKRLSLLESGDVCAIWSSTLKKEKKNRAFTWKNKLCAETLWLTYQNV